jgi:transcriptional regulator with XRE-family HTH domain
MVQEIEPIGGPTFGTKLKALRETAGLTQEQLARRTGLHLGAVFKLEQGRRSPTWETVQLLAAALGVTCLEFSTPVALPEEAAPPPKKPRGRPRKPAGGAAPGKQPRKGGSR